MSGRRSALNSSSIYFRGRGERKKSERGTHKGDASSTRRGSEEVTAELVARFGEVWLGLARFGLYFLVLSLFLKPSPPPFFGSPRGPRSSGESSGNLDFTDVVPHVHVFPPQM